MAVTIREKLTKTQGRKFYLIINFEGKRWQEAVYAPPNAKYIEKRQLALEAQARRTRELYFTKHHIPYEPDSMQWLEFCKMVALRQENGDVKRKYETVLNAMSDCWGRRMIYTDNLTEGDCFQFRQYLGNKYNRSTPRSYWVIFRQYIKSAIREGYMNIDPCRSIKGPRVSKGDIAKQILSAEELSLLKRTATTDVHRAFLVCCLTGMTLPEIRKLKWTDIAYQRKELRYYRAKTKELVVQPLSTSVVELLGQKGRGFVFSFDISKPRTFNKHLKKWVEASDILKHITWYCARHTFAVLLLSNGADVKTVADLMGHTSLEHTVKYLKYTDQLKKRAIDNLPKI